MTAPTGDLRAALDETLRRLGLDDMADPDDLDDCVRALLLPVVESYGRACAATALRDAAQQAVNGFTDSRHGEGEQWAEWLRTCADATEAGR